MINQQIAELANEERKHEMAWISENRALMILCGEGDFTESQANIVLGHALKKPGPLFDSVYIYKRARENRAKPA